MTADTSDWVSFEEADTFQPSGIDRAKQLESAHRRTKKRSANRRSARDSSETNASSSSWMNRPVNDDSSWLPVAPPRYDVLEERDDAESYVSNGTPLLSRPPRAGQHGSSASSDGNSNPASLSSGSQKRPVRTPRDRAKERRGRARERRPSRGRAASETRDKPPSTSRTRAEVRGRSSSRTRSASKTRARSSSRTRVESVSRPQRVRNRSTSRTRVESPSPRCHNRSRSANRATRVASPSPVRRISPIPPMPNTEPKDRGRPTSMTQFQSRSHSLSRAMSLSPRNCSNRSVNSVGAGVPPRHAHSMTDRSVSSEQLGVRQRNGKVLTSSPKPARKEGGILERFFGDQVTEEAKNGYRNTSVHSSASVGSLAEAQQTESIHPRVLLSATIYKNAATNLWITTINTNQKGVATNPKLASKYLKAFSFPSEQEAREAAIANAPPKMMSFEESPICFVCKGKFAVFRRARHCRNCGACVCGGCTTTWSSKMLPETYNLKNESIVKVCKSCSYLTDSFRKALLQGNLNEAIDLYHTGNINLRCPLPPAEGAKKAEIMYPIHCAVQGGNLDIVRWLMDEHFCPIKLVKKNNGKGRKSSGQTSIVTSKGRSVLHIAMNGRKVDIIRYLVVDKGIPVYEMKDLHLSLRALEAVLLAFPASQSSTEFDSRDLVVPRWDETNYYNDDEDSYVCSSLGENESSLGDFSSFNENNPIETVDLVSHIYS